MPSEERTTTDESQKVVQFPGSLRDYFAASALQVILANHNADWDTKTDVAITQAAWRIANAMLRAREGT
jgi:hypothetical protein